MFGLIDKFFENRNDRIYLFYQLMTDLKHSFFKNVSYLRNAHVDLFLLKEMAFKGNR
jgi:hypothetical protein